MITDLFSSLLKELGEEIKVKNLQPDDNNSCLIRFPSGLEIQIEPDGRGEFLIIGTSLGIVHPGRYRENIFREALKANGMPLPRYGIFCYSKKSDNLVLYDTLLIEELTGVKIADFIKPFMEKALRWKEAISHGEIPSLIASYSGNKPAGMFGIK